MDIAIEEGLGCFYDIEDPRRCYQLTLDELANGRARETYFRLGIRYSREKHPDEPVQHGVMLVVKNHLPKVYDNRIKSYITEDEIMEIRDDPISPRLMKPREEASW